MRRDRTALFRRGFEQVGPIFTVRLLNRRAAVLIGPEHHQRFFAETDRGLSMHKTYAFLRAMFGEVAFVASPEVYRRQRPVLHAPFKGEKMPGYLRIMQLETQQWLDSLGAAGEFELTAAINALVQNVAAHALMGQAFRDRLGRDFWDLYAVLGRALDPLLPAHWPLPKFIRRDRAKARLRAMLRPILAERRANPAGYDDFLQEFLHARDADGQPVDDETAISLILGLMFAGHETTAGQAAWTIILLLQHPDYLARVQAEARGALAPGQPVDLAALHAMPHLAWAVQESTRLYPSADMLLRLAETDLEVGDYRIPPGWPVFITAAVAHRLPALFAGPECYDPERFAPDRAEDRQHRFAMIPFGGGVHKCTGMNFALNEIAVITSLLLRQFDLDLLTPNPRVHYGLGAGRPTPTVLRYQLTSPTAAASPPASPALHAA
jgi:sterol 14-demethylase